MNVETIVLSKGLSFRNIIIEPKIRIMIINNNKDTKKKNPKIYNQNYEKNISKS